MKEEKPASRIFLNAFKITLSASAAMGLFTMLVIIGIMYIQHNRQISLFKSTKTLQHARISYLLEYNGGYSITVQLEDGADAPEIPLDTNYYPDAWLDSLEEGQAIDVYVNPHADQVVPVEQYTYFMNDISYIKTELILVVICILILAIDPRVLLLGTKGWSIMTMLKQEKRK